MEKRKPIVTVYEPTAKLSDRSKPQGEQDRKPRVAAYCRVSTETEEQQGSFKTQVDYYTGLLQNNPEYEFVGIYADEGISGAQADNRPEFLRMVKDALDGKIDLIFMKSISRLGRNTLDNVHYIRTLKAKGVYIRFEEEGVDTASEQCEFMLTIMSSLGQQEIVNTSAHVKRTFRMRMERGEMVGGSVPLGYGFDKETRSLYIIEEEAKIVRYIFDRYCAGVGGKVIARECSENGWLTKKKSSIWRDSTIIGIISNERYKGDLYQGKTFTVDPISKKRLRNLGESASAYVENHHPAIVSKEVWEQANQIRKTRTFGRKRDSKGRVVQYSRDHTMSSMLQCGFCGHTLTRKAWNSGTEYAKVVWHCCNSIKQGKHTCPHSKGISEELVQKAFVLAYNAIFKDRAKMILDVLKRMEEMLMGSDLRKAYNKLLQEAGIVKAQINKLATMYLDGDIDDDQYKAKMAHLKRKLGDLESQIDSYDTKMFEEGSVASRLKAAEAFLNGQSSEGIHEFSPELFGLVVEQVVVGSNESGRVDPYKLAFIFKGSDEVPELRNGMDSTQMDKGVPPILYTLLSDAGETLQSQGSGKKKGLFGTGFERLATLSMEYPHTTFKKGSGLERKKCLEQEIEIVCILDLRETNSKPAAN